MIERDLGDGRKATIVCETEIHERAARQSAELSMQAAIVGLRAALEAIRDNSMIPASERAEAIREMREAIEELESETRNLRRTQARAQSKLGNLPLAAPNARLSAFAMGWQGWMVSPVQAVTPVRMTIPAPTSATDADCDRDSLPEALTIRV